MVDAERYSEDDLMVAVDAGAEDIVPDEDVFEVITAPADFAAVRERPRSRGVESTAPSSPTGRPPSSRSTRPRPANSCA